jgi:hypothetical protein
LRCFVLVFLLLCARLMMFVALGMCNFTSRRRSERKERKKSGSSLSVFFGRRRHCSILFFIILLRKVSLLFFNILLIYLILSHLLSNDVAGSFDFPSLHAFTKGESYARLRQLHFRWSRKLIVINDSVYF